ncbi:MULTISPECIES: hypothetical protein [Streptomyces]|uniref:hypothetical protein n=1 Tax=Streptomyces TaxID=1883 RepID=UPI0004CD93DD|nr:MULTISPECIES: hypothetical protein [Streptomyces]KOT60345.1 hypothetical protein ADK43_14990 [Streptomyces rimosus subsp. rimosus]
MKRKLVPGAVRVALLGPVMALANLLLPPGTARDLLVLCADALVSTIALCPRPSHHRAPCVPAGAPRPWRFAVRARVRRSCSGRGPEQTNGVEQ